MWGKCVALTQEACAQKAGEQADARGPGRAVGTAEALHLAWACGEVQTVDGTEAAILLVQGVGGDDVSYVLILGRTNASSGNPSVPFPHSTRGCRHEKRRRASYARLSSMGRAMQASR
jgi:hypothetical protein